MLSQLQFVPGFRSPVHSIQHQHGSGTAFLQCTHSGIGFSFFLSCEIISRAELNLSLAKFSIIATSLSKMSRWTLNIPWVGKWVFLSAASNSIVEFIHSGSEHKSTVVVSPRQSMQTIFDPPGVDPQ